MCRRLAEPDAPFARTQVVLVALPGVDLNAVEAELSKQCDALPRNETARKALKHSYAIRVAGQQEAIEFSNEYAPEHLIVNVEDAESWLPALDNAGGWFNACFKLSLHTLCTSTMRCHSSMRDRHIARDDDVESLRRWESMLLRLQAYHLLNQTALRNTMTALLLHLSRPCRYRAARSWVLILDLNDY